MKEVYITRLAKFLPNEPVGNDEMESILGLVDGKPSRARLRILGNNKIKTRYYSLDKEGKSTHSNAEMTATAVNSLFDDKFPLSQLQLLACGTTSPDQLLPNHAAMVHGLLKCQPVELIAATGACAAGMQAFKYAWMSIKCGNTNNAVSSGSEKFSSWMLAEKFEPEAENLKQLESNPIIAFEKDFLRWMLSDGASAALFQDKPNEEGLSLRVDWVEIASYAHELETCMYAGSIKNEDGSTTGWIDMTPDEWAQHSVFSFKQDTRLLGANIVPSGAKMWKELVERYNIDLDKLDYFLPHLSSEFFRFKIDEEITRLGVPIPQEKWFTNLTKVGNVGTASPYLMLEELLNNDMLKKGQTIVMMVPESARFSYAYAHITVV
ncbi:beta-ketoacyl-ACP synthase III [Chitinophaga pinensis]|uniref:3-Oxoacyl-(Acyl-carrier-protein (ACP)) synthase III domain protein n=2 Tax=Chitinophaga pinensis TaxID=79329 RepID=A0A979GZV9_CHIPD|nr:beta-ketoacyl-ACP synthase III [Chitinophaga pinensis]ACU64251.1 3-Oxoacyl-(acyl-carrier-protein (ACP)) synthase III domain protein [Chitinophaga pinensis DSM 2588]TWW01977.1 StlD/DarB family beta-ketosynthase [Chitinophaga pinensis]